MGDTNAVPCYRYIKSKKRQYKGDTVMAYKRAKMDFLSPKFEVRRELEDVKESPGSNCDLTEEAVLD